MPVQSKLDVESSAVEVTAVLRRSAAFSESLPHHGLNRPNCLIIKELTLK